MMVAQALEFHPRVSPKISASRRFYVTYVRSTGNKCTASWAESQLASHEAMTGTDPSGIASHKVDPENRMPI